MATTLTLERLAGSTGTDLGHSPWRVVEQSRVDLFADATDDHQWIHVDPERAAEGPFGTTIAHGYPSLSLVPVMLDELLEVPDRGRGLNYGAERLRFIAPVPVGSRIRLRARIARPPCRGTACASTWLPRWRSRGASARS